MVLKDIKKCSGCYACKNTCPQDCIELVYNEEGFWYPQIDESKCLKCKLCEKICPINMGLGNMTTNPLAFMMKNNDDTVRQNSSSGGIFSLIAEEIIKRNGVVFGAAFTNDFKAVHHIAINDINDLYMLRGSKYLQSRIGDSYKLAKEYLEQGKYVLFSGTPCQIGGLKAFLQKDYERLVTQDIICHGVPSPLVWKKYVEHLEKTSGASVSNISFRSKVAGWKSFSMVVDFTNNKKIEQPFYENIYMKGFLTNLYLRPSCYDCHFKSVYRESDITLADFWGIEKISTEFDDDKGTSLVFINSLKGKMFLEMLDKRISYCATSLEEAIKYNPSAVESSKPHARRNFFFSVWQKHNIIYSIKKALGISKTKYLKKFYKKVIRIMKG